jgi:hypothetical protein
MFRKANGPGERGRARELVSRYWINSTISRRLCEIQAYLHYGQRLVVAWAGAA